MPPRCWRDFRCRACSTSTWPAGSGSAPPRDGAYPAITVLVGELERARAALARGRARVPRPAIADAFVGGDHHTRGSTWTARAEAVLARLYVDDAMRTAFAADPAAVARAPG